MPLDSLEILCSECGEETLVRREPKYDGFKKVGETFICTSCGHEFPDRDSVPFKREATPGIFTHDDKPDTVEVFRDDEKRRNCRYCKHYTVNPFAQRCGLHDKPVEATDLCDDFEQPETDCGPPGMDL
jgi:hypothetical protein